MPELPEVEIIVRDLRPVLLGQKIISWQVKKLRLLKTSLNQFKKFMVGATIRSVGRRAKLILLELSSGYTLLIHLKMTGQLIWSRKARFTHHGINSKVKRRGLPRTEFAAPEFYGGGHPIVGVTSVPNKYTYITVGLSNGGRLYFNDVRTFGYWQLVKSELLAGHFRAIGPEPLDNNFTVAALSQRLQKHRRTTIKAALLNQEVLVGLGNIYVDESLFAAGIRPTRPVAKLTAVEIIKLYKAIRQILKQAIAARGTSFNSYRDGRGRMGSYWGRRLVYGRGGEACPRCRRPIKRIVVAGRGTHYCSKCQR